MIRAGKPGSGADLVREGPRESAVTAVIRSARLWRIWTRLGLQDLRLRFRRSTLGVSWIFVQLAVMIFAVGAIYGRLLGQDLSTFLPFLAIGLVTWGFLTAAIVEGGSAFVAAEGYIKQISLPIYVYVFRAFVSTGITALVSLAAALVVALTYGVPLGPGTAWILPGLLLVAAAALLLVTIFAHLNARFRDTTHLAVVALQILFYVTPVLWPADLLRGRDVGWVVELNPLFHLLEVVRHPLLHAGAAGATSYVAAATTIVALALAAAALIRYYHRRIVYLL
jgi:ABC-type polysaccharide/polyol phosphate export permease